MSCSPVSFTVSMVGDVNLFLNNADNRHCAEIEVMIAEPSSRGRGLGLEATLTMMHYGMCHSHSIVDTSLIQVIWRQSAVWHYVHAVQNKPNQLYFICDITLAHPN